MKGSLTIKRTNARLLVAIMLVALASIIYVYSFFELLDIGETEGKGFNGIVQSDTITFRNIYLNSNISAYLEARVKNTILPALLWSWLGGDWYLATVLNVSLLLLAAIYLRGIARHMQIGVKNRILLCIVLLPETFIYSIGVLKEIPTLLVFSAMTFYFLKKRWTLFVVSLALLVALRYQFIMCVGLFFVGQQIYKGKNIRFLVVSFVLLASAYPFLIANVPGLGLEDAKLYRELDPGSGIGAAVEKIQSSKYGVAFFATIVRLFQMIIEPWPSPGIYIGGNLSVIALVYSVSAFIMLPIWFRYFRFLTHAFRHPSSLSRDQSALLCLSFSFVMMVALNSFVHHRYLYPGVGLILLVAYIAVPKMPHSKQQLAAAQTSGLWLVPSLKSVKLAFQKMRLAVRRHPVSGRRSRVC